MRPDESGVPLLGGNFQALSWVLAWWSINHFPMGIVERFIKWKPAWIVVLAGSSFSRALLITSKVDLSVKYFPGNYVAPLVMGTMAGMAGKSATQIVMRCFGSQTGPNEILLPGFVWWSGFQCACFYYFTVYLFPIFEATEAWALICTLLIIHSILQDVTGMSLDFTVPFKRLLMFCANLPDPAKALERTPLPEPETSANGGDSKKNR